MQMGIPSKIGLFGKLDLNLENKLSVAFAYTDNMKIPLHVTDKSKCFTLNKKSRT